MVTRLCMKTHVTVREYLEQEKDTLEFKTTYSPQCMTVGCMFISHLFVSCVFSYVCAIVCNFGIMYFV